MKHLKEYSQFGSDSLYEPISYDEYIEFISSKSDWGKPLGFTDGEVNSIKSVLGSEDRFQLVTNGPLSKNPDGELISVSGGYYGGFWSKKASWNVTITKYRDEWFVLQLEKVVDMRMKRIESEFLKCDTIDGVIQLIKDVSSSIVNESNSTDEWYYEVSKSDMETIPSEDFIDIDSRVLGGVESGLTEYIRKNCPRVSVRLTRDNWIGLKSEGIVIDGFDYGLFRKLQSEFEKGKWHPIKWMRRVKISQLKDEWFLVGITSSDYSIYFKCDQIDGLMKLLEDYYICERKMIKESVEEDKEILSDYFVDFEDGGGKVLIKSEKVKNGTKVTDIVVHEVTIYTNEPHIRKKVNWRRLSSDWDILGFDQQNHKNKDLPKRTFRIYISRKGEVKKPFWFSGYGTVSPLGDRTKKLLGLNESMKEKLAKKISNEEWIEFEASHKVIRPDDSDIELYKEFMLKNFTLEEVQNFQNVNYNLGFNWICEFDEINDNGDSYNNGFINMWKFDDEWYIVEKMVKGWRKEWTYWLVDTKEGFKDIDLWD